MSTPLPQMAPNGATSSRRSGLAVTLAAFFCGAAALSAAPLPDAWRPLKVSSLADGQALAMRVVARPTMTLSEHEDAMVGTANKDGRDAPDGEGISDLALAHAREEAELVAINDGARDIAALPAIASSAAAIARPPVDRARVVRQVVSQKEDRFREQARSVKAPGASVDNPCVERRGDACVRTALDPFFSTLDALARQERDARAAVVVLGNSLIASDHVTDVVRARLVERFGDGGRGFLLPDRLSKIAGRRVRTGQASAGWEIFTFAQDEPSSVERRPVLFGFSGSVHVSSRNSDSTTWATQGARRARLFYVEHAGQPTMRLLAKQAGGAKLLGRIDPVAADAHMVDESFDVELPAGTTELQLVADGPGAIVSGVALERDAAGVVVDTIGVPAANVRAYVDGINEDVFVKQLAARDPALVVLMLGGNEVRAIDFGKLDEATVREKYTKLVERVQRAAPRAACLLVAPIDAAKATSDGGVLTTREPMTRVIAIQQEVARARGCAHFNLFAAMGGAGSLNQFKAKGFLSDDLVHPTWRGGDVLGQLFADALLDSYTKTPPPTVDVATRRQSAKPEGPAFFGLSFPQLTPTVRVKGAEKPMTPRPLARLMSKLRALEQHRGGRVAIGQLGASHTAGQAFTDRVRERLVARFGAAGRGYVSAGRSSQRLERAGVFRSLDGAFDIADGRDVVLGAAVGMSGTKVRLEPGARFAVRFCEMNVAKDAAPLPLPAGCFSDAEPGFLQLSWLFTPEMGSADVTVDGRPVARLSAATRTVGQDVQFLRVPIASMNPVLEVVALGAPEPLSPKDAKDKKIGTVPTTEPSQTTADAVGPVNLLGVVEERERAGVIVDAVGLPGTTGMTPQRWRQDLLSSEVAARRYDLIITAWGTNEAGIASLDETTYNHHFSKTLETLLKASPGADCVIVGASDRMDLKGSEWRQAPSHALVERVQRDVAAMHGCAFFSMRTAMGGPGSMAKWVADGLGHVDHVHFTTEGYRVIADRFVDDFFSAYATEAGDVSVVPTGLTPTAPSSSTTDRNDRRGG